MIPASIGSAVFLLVASASIGFVGLLLLLALFGPDLPYRVKGKAEAPLDSSRFCSLLATLTDAQPHDFNRVEVLTNGDCFYEAELAAIRGARLSINLEAYIFQRGVIAGRFVEALAERARDGVEVKVILDYIGSLTTWRSYFRDLLAAGGRLEWYHPPRLDLLPQINNRTHRELLVVDGRVAFMGGAGIADQWLKASPGHARWRDTMFRVEGPAVVSLQSVFAENWLEVSGDILTGPEYFNFDRSDGSTAAFVVNSTPAGGATRARILFQLLIASARKRIYITTPYFLPDRSARQAVIQAIRDRHVEVKILTPGKHADHLLTRTSSRHLYGPLLRGGAEIHEYQPAMIHAKVMIVDDLWAVVGSTNFDHRSFRINDEVNLAMQDAAIATRLTQDFFRDLEQSSRVTYDEWRRYRSARLLDWLGSLIERQE
jgi:cardiolipin synthase